jgi:two-component system sensor histidine kinase DctS
MRGAGVYVPSACRPAGHTLQLRVDSARPAAADPEPGRRAGAGLSLALGAWCCCWRATCASAPRRAALAEALAFRKAMEDSLVTGLRARDLDGRITYVNPAFCRWSASAPTS